MVESPGNEWKLFHLRMRILLLALTSRRDFYIRTRLYHFFPLENVRVNV